MKKQLLFLLMVTLSICTTIAQEKNKQIGIRFNNGGYDILIKKQRETENTYSRLRIGSNVGNFNLNFNKNDFYYAANFNFAFGKEKHMETYKNLYFILGNEYLINTTTVGYGEKTGNKVLNFAEVGFGYGVVLGFGYEVVPKFNVALEMIPNVMGSFRTYYNNSSSSFNTSVNTGQIVFTALYTF